MTAPSAGAGPSLRYSTAYRTVSPGATAVLSAVLMTERSAIGHAGRVTGTVTVTALSESSTPSSAMEARFSILGSDSEVQPLGPTSKAFVYEMVMVDPAGKTGMVVRNSSPNWAYWSRASETAGQTAPPVLVQATSVRSKVENAVPVPAVLT
jgi:hypothetical protein